MSKLASSRPWIVAGSTLVAALVAALVLVPGAEAAVVQPGAGLSTNYDFARLVLRDGGWPTSVNNVTALTQWLRAEEPASNWWDRDNPLNNGLGSGGGSGLGSYRSVVIAAYDVAKNLETPGYGYPAIVQALRRSAPPSATVRAIWDSHWAAGHYGFGADWSTTPVPSVAAPPSAWQSPTACPIEYPSDVVGPCGTGFTTTGSTWRSGWPSGAEGQELWAFSSGARHADGVRWHTHLARGTYVVAAFVPTRFSDARVVYVVADATGRHRVAVDQEPYVNTWVTLGTFVAGGAGITVSLSTASAGARSATYVAADAMRFLATDPVRVHALGAIVSPTLRAVSVPGRPQDVTAIAGDAKAVVSWLAPSKDGGAAVRRYAVTAVPGGRSCATSSAVAGEQSCTVEGLADGTAYTFVVRAVNRVGASVRSVPSSPARPVGSASLSLELPHTLTYGTVATYRVQVRPATATGTVLFAVDGVVLPRCAAAAVAHGRAACATRLTATGTHALLVTFSGGTAWSGALAAGSLSVERATSTILVAPTPRAVTVGDVLTVKAWALPGRATGKVVVTAGAVRLFVARAHGGGATCTVRVHLAPGVHQLVARYVGNRDYAAAAARSTVRVLASTP